MSLKIKIFVIGDKIIDQYLYTDPFKLSDEAPVLVVNKNECVNKPGGAANVAYNLQGLGAEVDVFYGNKAPSNKIRVIAQKHHIVRIDDDNFDEVEPPKDLESRIAKCDAIAISDYNKGVITPNMIKDINIYAQIHHRKIFVDPYKNKCGYGEVDLIKPNKAETESVTGIKIIDRETLIAAGQKYLELSGAKNLIITMGSDGMALFDHKTYFDSPCIVESEPMEFKDITGAGDTVFAVLAFIWAHPNFSKSTSMNYANKAGAIACDHLGTYAVSFDEVFNSDFKPVVSKVEHILKSRRGKKIVMANGCFDILHIGHFNTLKKAKTFGDILVVALNSDESVRKLKGPNRPIFKQEHRARMLADLPYVDYVVYFNDMEIILNELMPDVVVKGDETWKEKDTVEKRYAKKYGKKIEFVKQLKEEAECKKRIADLRSGFLKDTGASGHRSSYHESRKAAPTNYDMDSIPYGC